MTEPGDLIVYDNKPRKALCKCNSNTDRTRNRKFFAPGSGPGDERCKRCGAWFYFVENEHDVVENVHPDDHSGNESSYDPYGRRAHKELMRKHYEREGISKQIHNGGAQ